MKGTQKRATHIKKKEFFTIEILTLTALLHYFRFRIFNVFVFFGTKCTEILEKSCCLPN